MGETLDLIRQRLDEVALNFNGVFFKGDICKNKLERSSFDSLYKNKSEFFETVFCTNEKLSCKLLKLKMAYYSQNPNLSVSDYSKLSDEVSMLRPIIWRAFCEQEGLISPITNSYDDPSGIRYYLDTFSDSQKTRNGVVLTIPERVRFWEFKGVDCISPAPLYSKRMSSICSVLHSITYSDLNDPSTWHENDPRLLPGGFWPTDDDYPKKKSSLYPGLNAPLSNKAKIGFDISRLEELGSLEVSQHLAKLGEYKIGIFN